MMRHMKNELHYWQLGVGLACLLLIAFMTIGCGSTKEWADQMVEKNKQRYETQKPPQNQQPASDKPAAGTATATVPNPIPAAPAVNGALFKEGEYEGRAKPHQYVIKIDNKTLSTVELLIYRGSGGKLFFDAKKPEKDGDSYKFPVMSSSTEPRGYIYLKPNTDGTITMTVNVRASKIENSDAHKNEGIVLTKIGQ